MGLTFDTDRERERIKNEGFDLVQKRDWANWCFFMNHVRITHAGMKAVDFYDHFLQNME